MTRGFFVIWNFEMSQVNEVRKELLRTASIYRKELNIPVIMSDLLTSIENFCKTSTKGECNMNGRIIKVDCGYVFSLFIKDSKIIFKEINNNKYGITRYISKNALLSIDGILAKQKRVSLEGKGHIYLVSDGKNTKIGATTYNPTKRLNELQVGNAKKLTLIGSYQVERRIATESLLHKNYQDKNIRGEWFNLSGQDIVDILNNRTQSSVNSKYQVLTAKDVMSISSAVNSLCDERNAQLSISNERTNNRATTSDRFCFYKQSIYKDKWFESVIELITV